MLADGTFDIIITMATPCMHAAGPVCSEQYAGVWYGRLQQCEGANGLLADLLLWTWVSSGEEELHNHFLSYELSLLMHVIKELLFYKHVK